MAKQLTGDDLHELLKEQALLEENMALLSWDQLTGMPVKSGEFRAELMAYLTKRYLKVTTGKKAKALLDYYQLPNNQSTLSIDDQALFQRFSHDIKYVINVPADDYIAFERLKIMAQDAWAAAREKNDYAIFKPYLEKLIHMTKQLIPLWQTDEQTPYDVLLGQYEQGLTTKKLDSIFNQVKQGLGALQQELQLNGETPDNQFLHRSVPKGLQLRYIQPTIQRLGFDFERGRLDDTVHPFMQDMNRNDARITTRWSDRDFKMAVLGLFHEAGHGMFAQNVDSKWDYTPFNKGIAMSIHESQSLFNEVIIGQDEAFWYHEYPKLQDIFGDVLADISFEQFYDGWMKTEPTLIRTEADPLTYPLHIIIRYEIEKAIFNDDLDVSELPALWREKYRTYLGVVPEDDVTGILQDIHWADASFGYFPSYALGHLYAAQFRYAMNKELDISSLLQSGDYQPLIDWRRNHIWQYGASKSPSDILLTATGEPLNPNYWLDLQRKRYEKVYQVKVD
ncbi:carboxypeptidase M32 [Weissella diestrammenae]|uniref:Metal-dependent carboxypeptidase n=1 Tax=Weissella diestrammenae TaxID=1162633 RepID=A0A7G9T4E8_9LACO|nr:carboxypeptidase M32 [Weissella diestrammenae]MCM0583509.1 carboxypeptidase M32 [Weissella diestrammenae]QNN74973.1 carboxypeptidase M32 [Weissella diestrammenae]